MAREIFSLPYVFYNPTTPGGEEIRRTALDEGFAFYVGVAVIPVFDGMVKLREGISVAFPADCYHPNTVALGLARTLHALSIDLQAANPEIPIPVATWPAHPVQ